MKILKDTHIDFLRYRRFWYVLSLVGVLGGVAVVVVPGQVNLGIDFAGGTQLIVRFADAVTTDDLRTTLAQAGFAAQIQKFGEVDTHEALIKLAGGDAPAEEASAGLIAALDARFNSERAGRLDLNRAGVDAVAELLRGRGAPLGEEDTPEELAKRIVQQRYQTGIITSWEDLASAADVPTGTLAALREGAVLGSFVVLDQEYVGPQIGSELRLRGIWAVVLASLGILGYIWFRFKGLRFAVGTIVASVHDVLLTLCLYALLGYEFNLTSIAAFLTLVGYSVNDSVVIFDRVRENLRLRRQEPYYDVLNLSINQTLSRTILTSGTTLLASGALLTLGGSALRGFAFVLTAGVIVGTYSTIYIATPITLMWERFAEKRGGAGARGRPARAEETSDARGRRGVA